MMLFNTVSPVTLDQNIAQSMFKENEGTTFIFQLISFNLNFEIKKTYYL